MTQNLLFRIYDNKIASKAMTRAWSAKFGALLRKLRRKTKKGLT